MEQLTETSNGEYPLKDQPKVYVASLADYVNGELHGSWIEANQPVEALEEAVQAILRTSHAPGAEEYAIHDYDGFGCLELSEYESLGTISALGQGIAEHGPAYAAFASLIGTSEATTEKFLDCYQGSYDSIEELVDEFIEDMGWNEAIEKFGRDTGLGSYVTVDRQAMARDFQIEFDIIDSQGKKHLFRQ